MKVKSEMLEISVIPFLKEYRLNGDEGAWSKTEQSRIILLEQEALKNKKRMIQVLNLAEKLLGLEIGSNNLSSVGVKQGDILIDLKRVSENIESYQIEVKHDILRITAENEEAVLHAFQSLKQLLDYNNTLPLGTIFDYPDMSERRLHLDMGRKFYSFDWIVMHIKKLSELKINTLQLHFSENKGFRIESQVDPEIVSQDGFLKKSEIKEIIRIANIFGIKIIPALDTPGHVEHILKTHPEYGQVDIHGQHSKVALDITNSKAVDYMKTLYDEFMELFSGSEYFHIGSDEYLEFNREPFNSQYQPVLDAYALKTWGKEYSWKDVVAAYINDISQHVYQRGFKPRIWNDAIYFGEEDEQKQKISMHPAIGIDYWSHMPWLKKVSSLSTILKKGHNEVYNVSGNFFYYVLRDDMPSDGRAQHSFDVVDQDKNIYDNWTPGKFTGETIRDNHPAIQGACLAIWSDNPNLVSEDVVSQDIHNELIAFAAKTWDIESNMKVTFQKFKNIITKINLK